MRYVVLFLLGLFLVMCSRNNEPERKAKMDQLNERINKFVETKLTYDHNLLNERQKKVVEKLYKASKIVDEIYLDQVYSRNKEIRAQLQSSDDPLDKLTLEYFNIMFGPFDRLDHNKPFYGTQEKPLGANFYPEDMTKQELEQWIKDHPEDEKAFTSEFTVIRRQDGKLMAIPYSEYYKGQLTLMSNLLKEAAQYADNPSLKRYLLTRAEAFLTNDYFESDMAWMDLKDNLIEVVIGPYEVYEDE
ncbi:MAG TPA: peptidase, partial [Caldithrix abyssi]|nr:peptidase [Caldithrix abyssi]